MAIGENPSYADAFYNIANTLLMIGRYKEAGQNFDKVITLAPNYAEAYHGKAVVAYQLHQYEQAVLSDTKAIENNPNYGQAWYGRGMAHLKINQLNNACNDFRTALNLGVQEAGPMIDNTCIK